MKEHNIIVGAKLKHIDEQEFYHILSIEGKGDTAVIEIAYRSNPNKEPFTTTMKNVKHMMDFGRWIADD